MSKNNRSRGPEKDRGTSPPFDYKKQTNADDKQRIHLGFDSKFSSNQLKAPSNNSPVNVDKSKKLFSHKLNKMIEENQRLKTQNSHLKEINQSYLDNLGEKERLNQAKGSLVGGASRELEFHINKFQDKRVDIGNLVNRETNQQKNLRGIVKYAKTLTKELEMFKGKVQMAERIIQDLRSTGNESLDSLITMLNGYQQLQIQTQEEIQKLKKLVVLKDDEIVDIDQDIEQLTTYVNTAKGRLEEKEEELLAHIENNGRMIRRQDKLIVDLQQKNDVSQTAIIQTSEDAMKKLKEKNALQIKMRETEGQKSNLTEQIAQMQHKLMSFSNALAGGNQAVNSQHHQDYLQQPVSAPFQQVHQEPQWKKVSPQKGNQNLKSAFSNKGGNKASGALSWAQSTQSGI